MRQIIQIKLSQAADTSAKRAVNHLINAAILGGAGMTKTSSVKLTEQCAHKDRSMERKPIVGIITNETVGFNGRQLSHSAGKRYVESVMNFADTVPILIPTCIRKHDLAGLLDIVDGIVLTGGRANVEPHHFNGQKFPEDEPIDPDRDRTVLISSRRLCVVKCRFLEFAAVFKRSMLRMAVRFFIGCINKRIKMTIECRKMTMRPSRRSLSRDTR